MLIRFIRLFVVLIEWSQVVLVFFGLICFCNCVSDILILCWIIVVEVGVELCIGRWWLRISIECFVLFSDLVIRVLLIFVLMMMIFI